jgi:hypothetical protein
VSGQKRYPILRFAKHVFWAFQRITLPWRLSIFAVENSLLI